MALTVMLRFALLAACGALAGCADFPEVDARLTPEVAALDYRPLQPLDAARLPPPVDEDAAAAEAEAIDARIARLGQRRADLDRPIFTSAEAERLAKTPALDE